MKEVFQFEVYEDGMRKKGRIVSKDYFLTRLQKFPVGKCKLTLEDTKPKRSGQQNRYLWMYYGLIAEETGHSPDEIHEIMKRKFLQPQILKWKEENLKIPASTTNLNKSEFSEYIMRIEAETGIQSPDTEEWMYGT